LGLDLLAWQQTSIMKNMTAVMHIDGYTPSKYHNRYPEY
jgi:ABC-type proline/glycine betaine transport system ATPase subunit